MPIVRIQMAKGRSPEEKTRLMKAVTDAIYESTGAPLPTIHIMIQEIPAEDIMIAGQLLSDKEKGSRI
jgi:4-oxalocrotonate tautomerase